MLDWLSLLFLAIIQGIAEWFPVSSSSQIILASKLMGYNLSLLTSVALHFGTLIAVFVYFGQDIIDILKDLLSLKFKTANGRMGIALLIATIPAGIAGYFLSNFVEENAGLGLMALGLGITSLYLFIGSFAEKKNKEISYTKGLIIGLAQIASLFRGISRSGSTIVTGLLLGLNEKSAVKFSFLLSIPIVLGANILELGNSTLPGELFWAVLVSFLAGMAGIHFSFKYILSNRRNLRWFALLTILEALGIGAYLLLR